MHLKNLELIGFKSFADRTVLEFGEGITAIVGPNGCGKSNISDAIRWVLGEQSARLLRGSKMEDCIFSGTDARKPLNLAEVSLTFTDCEKTLGTEYHEITVTRRVFHTGEGQYFINKTPCRLKDIQRLFMDTGIGTNSYSLMEQGRIDLILRARPDDRREVFEEASGITKFKTDKREALRKLEQTENNLLRLADIIKEVKRQIISLQRQAGKAARYRTMFDELRRLDIFLSREKLQCIAGELQAMDTTLATLNVTIETLQQDIQRHEQQGETLRDGLSDIEREIAGQRQADMEMQALLERTRQEVENNRRRIRELEDLIQRDTRDIAGVTHELDNDRRALAQSQVRLKEVGTQLKTAEADLLTKSQKNAQHEQAMDQTKQDIQKMLDERLELDDRHAKLQNELHQMENEDRHIVSRRERCAAEQANLKLVLKNHDKRMGESVQTLKALTDAVTHADQDLQTLLADREHLAADSKDRENRRSENQSQAAALTAQIALLTKSLAEKDEFSESVKQVLNDPAALGVDRACVLGALADQITAEPDYAQALEAVLRMWLDAVVVTDVACARDLIQRLAAEAQGSICLLAASVPEVAPTSQSVGAVALVEHVTAAEAVRPLLRRLLSQVWVIDSLEALPPVIPPNAVYVTRQGALVRGNGACELYHGDARIRNPLAQRHQVAAFQETLSGLHAAADILTGELEAIALRQTAQDEAIQLSRVALEEKRQALARREGEQEMVVRQTNQVRDNLETVTYELHELEKQGSSPERKSAMIVEMDQARARRGEIKLMVETRNRDLTALEHDHKQMLNLLLAANVRAAQHRQAVEHLVSQHQPLSDRIAQAEATIRERTARVEEYRTAIEALKQSVTEAQQKIPDLEATLKIQAERLQAFQEKRERQQAEFKILDEQVKKRRVDIEAQRARKNELTVKCAEARMKHEHILERVTGDYRLTAEAIRAEPEPEWSEGVRPAAEAMESQVAELRAKIESMGPVNTGAIDEYKQLQERFDFLTQQQDDLVKSKQQLMDLIRKINQTTTEMFSKTFAQINANFQAMFQQLFGGGTAKLILTDEEDILECGIEVYARPPGKRLQSISLLSGGESTMTAVALLFSIYMVKPSPFCLLDELDAALDDSNIHRFVKVLKGFLNQSQFLVITHNRQTISAAGTLYGVTMEADKVSRIMSMRFKEHHHEEVPSQPAAEAPVAMAAPAADAIQPESVPLEESLETVAIEKPLTGDTSPDTTG
ncbi:MAG: chromosome segregation protein SMC [Verrucomicrobia bacterium]|nr:chromosome segregation protein SMC [Verrucomicrobiota bacterium]MBU1735173.1 chromosome segregation protein SMC [Verrucomicrobiota bacterium]MBU1855956.1 chromosome segregation protein SMC [Verrucomicrobiota bacterium]